MNAAAIAAVTGDDGAVTGVQRTWLDQRLPARAGVASPRKALGRVYGRAVRFGRPADGASLLVGEGSETVLSVVTAVPDITAAAALSAGSLGAFAPPPGVAPLVIARDNDAKGERAAIRLARRCAQAGVAVTVVTSEGGDFNDDIVALGPHAQERMVRIVNLKHEPDAVARGAVRVDRRTRFGNPFVIGRHGTREQVVARYRAGELSLAELAALAHKPLACWCWPTRPCHAEVLARAAAWAAAELARSR